MNLITGVKVKSRILNRMNKNYKMQKLDDLTPLKDSKRFNWKPKGWDDMKKQWNSIDRTTLLKLTKKIHGKLGKS